jgi:hypothetical protein
MPRHVLNITLAFFLSSSVFAQTTQTQTDSQAREAERQRQKEMAEATRIFDRFADQQVNPVLPLPKRAPGIEERRKFYETVPKFRTATADYRDAVGVGPDVSKSLKAIEKLIDPLREYFNSVNAKNQPVDFSEFNGLSSKDLMWETLTTAENIDNNLQIARKVVQQSERDGVMNIKVIQFFIDIQDDLTRLRFLTSKVTRR